jgi:hypothetical protein
MMSPGSPSQRTGDDIWRETLRLPARRLGTAVVRFSTACACRPAKGSATVRYPSSADFLLLQPSQAGAFGRLSRSLSRKNFFAKTWSSDVAVAVPQ